MLHKSRHVDSANRPKLKMYKLPVNKIRVQMKIYRKHIEQVCRLDSHICTNTHIYSLYKQECAYKSKRNKHDKQDKMKCATFDRS